MAFSGELKSYLLFEHEVLLVSNNKAQAIHKMPEEDFMYAKESFINVWCPFIIIFVFFDFG